MCAPAHADHPWGTRSPGRHLCSHDRSSNSLRDKGLPCLPEPRTAPPCCSASLARGAQGPQGKKVDPGTGLMCWERWQKDTHHLQTPCARLPVSANPEADE